MTATKVFFVNNCAKSAISFIDGTSEVSLTFETGSESSTEKQLAAFNNVDARMTEAFATIGESVGPETYRGKKTQV